MTDTHPAASVRPALPTAHRPGLRLVKTAALMLMLFLVALAPRAFALGNFVTVDEAYHWFGRVEQFVQYVQQGDFASTNLTGHPGVTTMWLGALGKLAHQACFERGWISHAEVDPALYRAFLRWPVAMGSALCVALAYPLLRRLFGARLAVLACLLWATEPFLVAHGQLLHLDSLLTSFMSISLLAAMAAFSAPTDADALPDARHPPPMRWPLLGFSAIMGGLALLTKSPSIILVPMIGLIILVGLVDRASSLARLLTAATLWRVFVTFVVWVGIAAVVWVALWPLAWVDPLAALKRVIVQAQYDGGSPHGWGNFFLGRTVEDPGPLFYPVVIALRLTPWTMIGLFAAGVSVVWRAQKRGFPTLGMLALFALLFIVMMSIPPKKFDRYILPIFPALTIIAAFGYVRLAGAAAKLLPQAARKLSPSPTQGEGPGVRGAITWLLIIAALALNLAWYHPYELAYYNPLLGGGATAAQAIPVGWGEGYEQVGAFISSQPNGCDRAVASWFAPVASIFLCNHWVVSLDRVFEPGKVDYAVLYIDQIQRGDKLIATTYLRNHFARIHTVTIHGIEYAYVYQLPLPNAHRVLADFGSSIRLLGYDVDTSAVRASGVLTLTVQWMPTTPMAEDYMLFVHVFDASGQRVGQVDVPPGGPRAPTSGWKMNSYATWLHPVPVPADLPPGTYWIGLGVYNPRDFARLPVHGPPPPTAPVPFDDGPGVLVLEPFTL